MDISLIIPAYNEEERIVLTLEKTVSFFAQRTWTYEILVVDDGSTDDMVAKIQQFAQNYPEVHCLQNDINRGKGYSIRHGVRQSRGSYVGFMDADYKTDIAALDVVVEHLEAGCDAVIGDRTLAQSQIGTAARKHRQWGSQIFKKMLFFCFDLGAVGDTQCGFKFFKAEVIRDLFQRQRVRGYMFDVEILVLARKLGYRIQPVPVVWHDDPDSRFNPVTGMVRNFGKLARIRWIHR